MPASPSTRIAALPPEYRNVARALARYLRRIHAVDRGLPRRAVAADLSDLFERAAFDGTRIRRLVGTDPAAFAEAVAQNHGPTRRTRTARARLDETVARAASRTASRASDRTPGAGADAFRAPGPADTELPSHRLRGSVL